MQRHRTRSRGGMAIIAAIMGFLLLETGDKLLLEDGSAFLLE